MDKPSSSRINRLAQPRKYGILPSSKRKRSSSEEKTPKSFAIRTLRFRSASPLPLSRSLAKEWTPKSCSLQETSTYKKKNLKNQSSRIIQVIRKKFGENFLEAGLESMSAKQFVEIIKYFSEVIFGEKVVIRENNTEDAAHFIQLMDYPYQMNKSWLKTPTILGVYDRIVELMDWLCDFVSTDENECIENIVENEDVVTDKSNTFSSKKCLFSLIRGIKENYVLWNEKRSEFEESKAKLVASLVHEKTHINDIDSIINRMKILYKSMLNIQVISEDDDLLEIPATLNATLIAEVNQLKVTIDEKDMKYKEINRELHKSIRKNEELIRITERLNRIVDNQPVSADDRQKMVNVLEQNSVLVKQKRDLVQSEHLISIGHQEKIGILKKQRSSMIINCNSIIQNLFLISGGFEFSGITMEQLNIQEEDTIICFKEKIQLLSDLKDIIIERRRQIHASLNEAQEMIKYVKNELNKIEDKIVLQKNNVRSLKGDIKMVDDEIVDLDYSLEQEENGWQNKTDALQKRSAENEAKIQIAEKQAEELRSETGKIGDEIEAKANILLKAKEDRQARRMEALLELQKVIEMMKTNENCSK